MARSRLQLQILLETIAGVNDAWFQEDGTRKLNYPVIVYARDGLDDVEFADNQKYILMKRYMVTVVDRNPDSLIPDLVGQLPFTSFDRFYIKDGLNHFVYNLYF